MSLMLNDVSLGYPPVEVSHALLQGATAAISRPISSFPRGLFKNESVSIDDFYAHFVAHRWG